MTKIVLHGGETSQGLDDSPDFFREMLFDIEKNKVNILLVYFARPKAQWDDLFMDDMTNFENNTDKECSFLLASLADFEEQLKQSDIVFFKGGDGPLLIETITQYPHFRDLILGKVLGGTSAGANMFSKLFYSMRGKRVIEGLGILNIRLFTHYRDQYTNELNTLESYGSNISETVLLEEGEHKSFRI